jgi:CBS domain-containing protein
MTSPRHNSPGLGGRSPLLRCSQSHAALSALLHNTQLEDLLQDTPVVAFEQDTPIEEVLEVLSRHRILSAPVFLRQTDGQPSRSVQSLLGFVDVMSVLRAFIAGGPGHQGSEHTQPVLSSHGLGIHGNAPVTDSSVLCDTPPMQSWDTRTAGPCPQQQTWRLLVPGCAAGQCAACLGRPRRSTRPPLPPAAPAPTMGCALHH